MSLQYINYKINNLYHSIRVIPSNIKRLIKWFPIIWKDRDWDYAYLHIILRHKLESMLNYFTNDTLFASEGNDLIIKRIRFCIKMLDRLEEKDPDYNPYIHPELEKHIQSARLEKIEGTDSYTLKHDYELSKGDTEKYLKNEIYLRDRDRRNLYGTLYKYIEEWWD